MPTINNNGTELWYDIHGAGQPLVLSGGFGLLHNQYDFIREKLTDRFQIIDWNYRGAGNSDRAWPGNAWDQDTWVDDLEHILNSLDMNDVILWGTSTGSPLTIRYVARYQARVKAMITYPMFKADAGFRAAFDYFRGVCETFGYEALACLTSWIGCAGENIFQPCQGEMAKWEADCFRKNFSIETIAQTMDIVAGNDFTSDLSKIKVPCLLLLGESGQLGYASPGTRELADEFMKNVPHADLKTIPEGGGTYCMIEQPDKTAEAIIEFFGGL